MIEKRTALSFRVAVLFFALLAQSVHAILPGPIGGNLWVAQGGAPIWNGDAGVANGEVGGAIQSVVQHPANPDIMFVGTVNGGIWRTLNAKAASPTWTPLTDFAPSLSISSLVLDTADLSYNTLVASLGSYSSLARIGSTTHGLLRSTDGGNSWSYLDGGGILLNKNISGVSAQGNIVVVSVDEAVGNLTSAFGIYRSTNTGASFYQVSSVTGLQSGLPYGRARVLMTDPGSPAKLYTVLFARNGGTNGIYRSTDTGATWSKISNVTMDNLLTTSDQDSARISVGAAGLIYVGIQDSGNSGITRVFRSPNGGLNWSDLGLAQTSEISPASVQTSPVVMAVFADPGNTNIVYVGGGDDLRCDISQPIGSQWARLNGCISASPPNSGDLNCTSPHSDTRNMIFDLSGNLILVCDGGIYRRTNPRNYLGSWSSIIGNLQVGEIHDIAYDPIFGVVVAGTQDNGTQRQTSPAQPLWAMINGSDGGDVAVDSTSAPGYSIVYLSDQSFNFRRQTFNSTLGVATNVSPALTVTSGAAFQPQFVTPFKLNAVNSRRVVIGGGNSIYESLDQGDTIAEIGPGQHVNKAGNGFAYGGWRGGVSNPEVLYTTAASGVLVRTNAGVGLTAVPTAFPGGTPLDVALLTTDWMTVYVIDASNVFMSTNAGNSWTNITGNLTGVGDLICIRAGTTNKPPSILVGAHAGVYVSSSPNFGFWSMIGTNLPNAPVLDLEYNQSADLLLVGTTGRGAWMITNASSKIFSAAPPVIGTQPQSQTVLIDSTAIFSVSVGGTPPFGYQWRKSGIPIAGATNATLFVSLAQPTDAGNYDVVVSNYLNIVTSLTATLTVTGIPPAYCAMSAPSGLISWWTGDNTASDRVGISHGTLQNGCSYGAGKVGQAFSFDGVDDFVEISNSDAFSFSPASPMSVSLWAYRTGTATIMHLIGKRAGCGSGINYQMAFDGSGLLFGGDNGWVFTGIQMPMNTWLQLTATFDGSTFRFYTNGLLVATGSGTLGSTNTTPLRIGKSGDCGGTFAGMLDEVTIYNRALTSNEIQAIYIVGTNGMCPPTPLMFTSPLNYTKGNGFVLNASLRSSQSYRIQANTNLATTNWLTLTNFIANTAPVFHFTNTAATNFQKRFYRIVSP
jgi:hypothetical protein